MKTGLILEGGGVRGIYTAGVLDVFLEQERQGRIFVIRPHKATAVGRMETDLEKVQQVYEMGRQDAQAAAARLSAWLQQGKEETQ